MSGVAEYLNALPFAQLTARCEAANRADVRAILLKEKPRDIFDLAILLSPAASGMLEEMAGAAARLTAQRFGRTVLLYAPLYLSNECVNVCTYCGFRRDINVTRSTLDTGQIEQEARYLTGQGFRHLLVVAGEHPKHIAVDYVLDAVRTARRFAPSVSIEVQPYTEQEYRRFVEAGADGVTLYQEVYDPELYPAYHTMGPKKDYAERLEGPSRAARAGFRRIGIGALLGLAPWRGEILRLGAHAAYLLRRFWQTQLAISFPRIRDAASCFDIPAPIADRELAQMICALRLVFPDVALVLSTRESRELRDGLVKLGITQMSAGSRTEPGGYLEPDEAEGQFAVVDSRTPAEVADRLTVLGFEPVWKDWEEALHG